METPLVQHGPSVAYGTSYYYTKSSKGSRIIAVEGNTLRTPLLKHRCSSSRTFFDRVFKIDRIYFSPAALAEEIVCALPTCETPKRKLRKSKCASILTSLHRTFDYVRGTYNQLILFHRCTPRTKDHAHEPHAQNNSKLSNSFVDAE